MIVRVFLPIWPALVLGGAFFLGMAAFALLVRRGGLPELPDADRRQSTAIATPFFTRYVLWLLAPVERRLAAWQIAPTAITAAALLLCALSGAVAARQRLAVASWLYVFAGLLDILDGRVARRSGRTSAAGALIDSVADRWGEFFVLAGAAYYLRDSLFYVGTALLAIAGSQMVSYVRARGEALGLVLEGGTMQRAERIVLVAAGFLAGAIGAVTRAFDPRLVVSGVLLVVGLASTWTSLHRLRRGVLLLRTRADHAKPLVAPTKSTATVARARTAADSSRLG
jgi:phosphatidylglycerophosphate synthase